MLSEANLLWSSFSASLHNTDMGSFNCSVVVGNSFKARNHCFLCTFEHCDAIMLRQIKLFLISCFITLLTVYSIFSKVTSTHPLFLQMLPGFHLAFLFLPGVILLLLFPPHITPPYCFHSNAITEMMVFSRCYHSCLSSVHIWRLSSSQESCSLQQIPNCSAGSVGV